MKIELFPLEKITIDGHDIFLGQSKKQFIDCLGQPEVIYENYGGGSFRYHYPEFAFDVDLNDNIEFVEFLYGHEGTIKPVIYGVSAFDITQEELMAILKEKNNGPYNEDDCGADFPNISVGVFYENDDVYFETIGIGVRDYYNNPV